MIVLLKDARLPFGLLLLAYALLLNVNLLLSPPDVSFFSGAPLSQVVYALLKYTVGDNKVALPVIFIVLVWVQGLLLNALFYQHRLLEKRIGLPALFYIILISMFNQHLYFSPPFLAVIPVIISLAYIYNSYYSDSFTHYFDAAFAISVASLFYFPTLLLLLFVFIGITITRTIRWRQWITVIMGALNPYLLTAVWFYLTDDLPQFATAHFLHITASVVAEPQQPVSWIVKAVILAAITLLAYLITQQRLAFSVVKVKKMTNILTFLLLISLITFAFIEGSSLAPVALPAIPTAFFMTFWFNDIKNPLLAETQHILLLCAVFYFQYAQFIT
ncbi:MAG TPA: DUF6427 family protein [Chitinophagales bacterium]|nr:DUF6427 family protein [Chitinophagales bacterium]HRK27751.1 DUF6427 family protein [Chitinophagales bacterium]